MFPQIGNPQTGGGFNTSAVIAQNTGLLGNNQMQMPSFGTSMPSVDPGVLNSTAPQSSNAAPGVADMVKALKGNQ